MGSAAIQGPLWGKQPKDWATIQEQTGNAGYAYALNSLNLNPADKLLDVGCGSGLFSGIASATGAYVTGIDASEALIEQAWLRNTTAHFSTGEMEELPFADNTFDVVCGFNSFQYAASTGNAFAEARRVLKPGGKIVVMIWGNKEDCEAASNLAAIGSLLPPPPPGAPGPFALTENHLLEKILGEGGFKIINQKDIDTVWDYPDTDIALKGLCSSGPAARAIENSGQQKVQDVVLQSMQPYIQSNGHVVYKNKFRVVIAEK
ncbi:class I SAM-dependent methyltransferase [Mucilaginibacter sp. OK098]|uniref:class I SAM-dependent methyltransferase n=1 Tax=Mucilaginibacter sp. OK098 TaxID=1855297 RepID=UPI00091483FB|nr:class I SAM-dependent methyltransferase [Mucilaginibacter sp. OK098]SHN30583.1 Methyltransferase domain-containing protein [Mucilaginibacter sp. OK098]